MTIERNRVYLTMKHKGLTNKDLVALGNQHSSFTFEHRPYTYLGEETPDLGRSRSNLIVGNSYFVVNSECESHLEVELMEFVGVCTPTHKSDYKLLFIDPKKNYWVAKVEIEIGFGGELVLTIEGRFIGKNFKKGRVIQEKIVESFKLA